MMPSSPTAATLRDAALIFLAATVLGIAYNAVSPLGVQRPPAPPQTTTATSAHPVPLTPRSRGIQNETLSITIEESSEPTPKANPPASVSWAETKALIASGVATLVDAREQLAFAAGHIPGAISLPMNSFEAQAGAFAQSHPKDKTIVVYCASSQCSISRMMAQALRDRYGYKDVRDMPGGYAEWRLTERAADSPDESAGAQK
jgi:rhodanese-related sulfurtransferase